MPVIDRKVTADFWIEDGSRAYAGEHILVDIFGASDLDCPKKMEMVFTEAVKAAGANMLHVHMHHFGPGAGVSGVAVLSESHISVHTWPERGYAAFDIFMCGKSQPEVAVTVIKLAFPADRVEVIKHFRGETINAEIC